MKYECFEFDEDGALSPAWGTTDEHGLYAGEQGKFAVDYGERKLLLGIQRRGTVPSGFTAVLKIRDYGQGTEKDFLLRSWRNLEAIPGVTRSDVIQLCTGWAKTRPGDGAPSHPAVEWKRTDLLGPELDFRDSMGS